MERKTVKVSIEFRDFREGPKWNAQTAAATTSSTAFVGAAASLSQRLENTMKFRHAMIITVLKLAGFHVYTTLRGEHFILGVRGKRGSRALYIEEL